MSTEEPSAPLDAPAQHKAASATDDSPIRRPLQLKYVLLTVLLMAGFYAFLYHPWDPEGYMGRQFNAYLEHVARASATVLGWLGEKVRVHGNTVSGRFPYVVVLDCAALDAQALFAGAVLAFPTRIWMRLAGLVVGLVVIWAINVARLVGLYFAGASSVDLFHLLHEEVLVFVIIALVCGMFTAWAMWARRLDALQPTHRRQQPAAG